MRRLLTILVMLGVASCPLLADLIDLGLRNTGPDGWQVGGVDATAATTIPAGWAANTGTSSWISTQANADAIFDGASQAAPYNYTFQFTVPSMYALGSIIITGKWALDDYGTASIGSTVFSDQSTLVTHYTSGAFNAQTFTITSANGLVQGLNTLTFAVTNRFQGSGMINPTGVRVEFDSVTGDPAPVEPVPEPGTLMQLGGGLLALGLIRRFCRS